MNIITLKLTPANSAAVFTLPVEGMRVSADTYFFLRTETLNDTWEQVVRGLAQTTSVDMAAVQAMKCAADWMQSSDGHFALTWLLPGEQPLFVMIGEDLVTVSPDGRTYRLTGLPVDLVNHGDALPAGRAGQQVVVASWDLEIPDVLFIDLVDLDELTDHLR